MEDPFAPADEAQVQTQAPVVEEAPEEEAFAAPPEEAPAPAPAKKAPAKKAAPKVGTVKVDVQPNVLPVKVDGDGKVVLTFKGGTGFAAPWIVIHASDLQDAHDQVTGENAKLLAAIMERTQVAGQHFAKLGGGEPAQQAAPNNQGGGQQRQSAPQAAQEAPGGEKRYCSHGEMRFRSGVSKAGKPYSAFFCGSGDRNNECKAQFLR